MKSYFLIIIIFSATNLVLAEEIHRPVNEKILKRKNPEWFSCKSSSDCGFVLRCANQYPIPVNIKHMSDVGIVNQLCGTAPELPGTTTSEELKQHLKCTQNECHFDEFILDKLK